LAAAAGAPDAPIARRQRMARTREAAVGMADLLGSTRLGSGR
jgi:hypothetical protein